MCPRLLTTTHSNRNMDCGGKVIPEATGKGRPKGMCGPLRELQAVTGGLELRGIGRGGR